MLLAVAVGPWFSPYSPTEADFLALLAPPSLAHPFGTDSFGRDVLTRILYGARVSLAVSVSRRAGSGIGRRFGRTCVGLCGRMERQPC